MVDMSLPVLDVVDGGGGVYAQPSRQNRIRLLLYLRCSAQHRARGEFASRQAGAFRNRHFAR